MRLIGKIVLIVAATATFVIGTYSAVELQRSTREMTADSREASRAVLINATPALGKAIWSFDRDIINSSLQGIFNFHDVAQVAIFDNQGKLVAGMVRNPATREPAPMEANLTLSELIPAFPNDKPVAPLAKELSKRLSGFQRLANGNDAIAISLWEGDAGAAPDFLGNVVLSFTNNNLEARTRDLKMRMTLMGVILISSMAAFSVLFLRRSIVNPIRTLEDASLKIAKRHFCKIAERPGNDEIASLIRQFNQMSADIEDHVHNQKLISDASRLVSRAQTFEELLEATRGALGESLGGKDTIDLLLRSTPIDPFPKDPLGAEETSLGAWREYPATIKTPETVELIDNKTGDPLGRIAYERPASIRKAEATKGIVDAVAVSIANSITNIRYAIEQKMHGALEAELSATRLVQQALLPSEIECASLDVAAYYEPAAQTGGDWYGYYILKRGNFVYFFIGDVTGHGIPSALVTGVVCGAVLSSEKRAELLETETTPEIHLMHAAHSINHVVRQTGARCQKLMTMLIVALDVSSGEVFYLNAGHNHPLIVSKDEGAKVLTCLGSRLGFTDEPEFKVKKAVLKPNDILFLYTDGLIENSGPSREMMDVKSLKKVLSDKSSPESAQALVDHVVNAGSTYWKGKAPDDDVSLVCIRWLGGSVPPESSLKEPAIAQGA